MTPNKPQTINYEDTKKAEFIDSKKIKDFIIINVKVWRSKIWYCLKKDNDYYQWFQINYKENSNEEPFISQIHNCDIKKLNELWIIELYEREISNNWENNKITDEVDEKMIEIMNLLKKALNWEN